MQSHGSTLSFHREMADSSRELVGPDITAAVSFQSYPRFIKGGFQDYEGLGIKRSTADFKHVSLSAIEVARKQVFCRLRQKVVDSLQSTGTSDDHSKSSGTARDLGGTPRPSFQSPTSPKTTIPSTI